MNIAWRGNNSRLARRPEDSVNIYFVPGYKGGKRYRYMLVKASQHRDFLNDIAKGGDPDYAIILEEGAGEPDDSTRKKMKLLYDFEH